MEFGVLGPVAVTGSGETLPLRSSKQRILLAMLLSNANTPVSQRRLIEALWEAPPASAGENLRLYVYQLRRALGDGERITRHPSGYAMEVRPGELDAQRFDDGAADGGRALAEGDAQRASELLTQALALWRGPAFGDLADTPLIRPAALRLEEARLRATEDRIDAELRLGRHTEPVAELITLAETHPYREPLRAHLMRALYGAGRQAEALEVFRHTRALLIDQLGIEPGHELRRLHGAMLRGEPVADERPEPVDIATRANEPSPYRGLMAFQPEHQQWFFGREHLVDRLVTQVEKFPVVSVFGASGSGKSSLLRAGLLGRIAGDASWRTRLLTPTARPLDALAGLELTGRDEVRTLLVVDQFEELFTLCDNDNERNDFIAALLGLDRTTIVLGVRADFLAHVTQYPALMAALDDHATLLVGPPGPADLREIVVRPAAMAGLSVDADLLATALTEAGEEPGALPLLSHALLETWRNRAGRTLTLAAYQASGGVRGAIAQTAEREYDALDDAERLAVRRIFLRLTALGEGTEDTRRPIARAELDGIADQEIISSVLRQLADARLIVLDEHTVEVAHEALIRAWPRLHRWLSEDRVNLIVHRRLTSAAHTWHELDEDPGALYRGGQLVTATAWAEDHPHELNQTERGFLQASESLAHTEHTAARRRARLLKRLVATLAVLLVLALVGAGLAVWQGNEARLRQRIEQAHQLALTARQLLATDPDLAGLLSVEAYRLRADPETLGALLSNAAAARRRVDLNVGGTPVLDIALSPDGALLASADRDGTVGIWELASHTRLAAFTEHTSQVDGAYARTVAFDGAGGLLASSARAPTLAAGAGSVVVWDLASRKPVFQQRFERLTNAMAFSPNGAVIAVGTAGGTIELWDIRAGTQRILAGHKQEVGTLAFSPDGALLVSANVKEDPVVWDVPTGSRLTSVPTERVHTVAFGQTSTVLTTGSSHNGVRFWNLDGGRATLLSELPLASPYAWDISAPVDDRIAVADEDGLITIWDIPRRKPLETYQDRGRAETRSLAIGRGGALLASAGLGRTIVVREHALPAFSGHSEGVNDIDISPDGRLVASAGDDATVRLWDTAGAFLAVLGDHPDRVEAVAFSPDGHTLAAVTRNHTITMWDVNSRQRLRSLTYEGLGTSTDVAYHPDGSGIVTASAGRFRWDVTTMTERKFPGPPSVATALEFSPDGGLLVSTDPAGGMLIWDVAADRQARSVATGQGDVRDVAVSRDGTLIATAGANRTVKVWNTASGNEVATLTGHTAAAQVLTFSGDGHTLASAGEDRAIIVWDLASRTRTATLTGHTAPVQALTFTPDGTLISGGDDGRIIRWPLSPDAAITRICADVGRDLTQAEWATHLPTEPYHRTC